MNTAVFLHRAFSCGITVADMKHLTIGMINDIFIETANDHYEYNYLATQEDMDNL